MLYIYPAACYLKLRHVRYKQRAVIGNITVRSQYTKAGVVKELIAWVIFIVGLLLLVVENYQAIHGAILSGSATNPSSLCLQLECRDVRDWNNTYWGHWGQR